MTVVRFIGDPTGYVVDERAVRVPVAGAKDTYRIGTGWIHATPGRRVSESVLINLDQAYLIDDTETA
jgi:hypothetical protein